MILLTALTAGFLVSFLGQIVLSNSNIAATQLAVQENYKNAWLFCLGATVVEVTYLRLSLTGMNWVMQHKMVFKILGWVSVALFIGLAIYSFITAQKQAPEKKGILINNKINRFFLGFGLCAVNPVQIPFWFMWSTQLVQTNVLKPTFVAYNIFTLGAGLGTLAGMAIYIYGGNYAVEKMKTSNKTLNLILGFVFLITALIQLYKIIYNPWI